MIGKTIAILLPLLTTILFPSFSEGKKIEQSESEVNCLASAIFFEARNQTENGKKAVAAVIFNRIKFKFNRNKDTICKVVYFKCDFSWVCDKNLIKYPSYYYNNKIEKEAWIDAFSLAKTFILEYNDNTFEDNTYDAVYYHASYMKPKPIWSYSKKLIKTIKIEKHVFYSMKGLAETHYVQNITRKL